MNYIHNNPVAAGLVSVPEDYYYSSDRNYAGLNAPLEIIFESQQLTDIKVSGTGTRQKKRRAPTKVGTQSQHLPVHFYAQASGKSEDYLCLSSDLVGS